MGSGGRIGCVFGGMGRMDRWKLVFLGMRRRALVLLLFLLMIMRIEIMERYAIPPFN